MTFGGIEREELNVDPLAYREDPRGAADPGVVELCERDHDAGSRQKLDERGTRAESEHADENDVAGLVLLGDPSPGVRRHDLHSPVAARLGCRSGAAVVSATQRTDLSIPTVTAVMKRFKSIGIVRELTGRRRYRAFGYHSYLELLNEATTTPHSRR